MDKKKGTFEFFYSFFMLLFGFGMILSFIVFVIGMIILINFTFIYATIALIIILFGIFKGIFTKRDEGYEIELKAKDSKKLDNVIEKITKKTGLKKPHKIILVEDSMIAVSGLYRKKLIIGLATLQFLSEDELMAIIAHEYGHFLKKDTILGYLNYRIMNFIEIQKQINKENLGPDFGIIIHLPTWIFFWLFSRYYSLISLWYSRRVEFRADNIASEIVGERNFANALVKYCVISEIFEDIVPKSVLHYLEEGKGIVNLYDFIKPIYTKDNIEKSFEFCLSPKSSWWSTHPSISERLEALEIESVNLKITSKGINLIGNQEDYEKEASNIMTQKYAYWKQLMEIPYQQEEQQE